MTNKVLNVRIFTKLFRRFIMATNNKVKNVVLGVTAVSTVVAGAYLANNLLYKERDYSDILVESAKKYVENNNIAIDSKLVTSASRLKETDSLVSNLKDECVSNSYVTVTNEDGTYKYEPSLSCEPTEASSNEVIVPGNSLVGDILSYEVLTSSTKLTNGNIEVQVIFNEEVQNVERQGWTLSSDNRTLTKIFSQNGEDEFEVKALNNAKTATVKVSASNIDKEAPVILVNGKSVVSNYGTVANLSVEDANLDAVKLNGEEIENYSISLAGAYEVVATDLAGNKSVATFSLGRAATSLPVISRVKEGGVYGTLPLIITFSDGEGMLDGNPFKSADAVTTPGNHTLIVTNEIGSTTVNFIIDPTDPEVWAETEAGIRVNDGKSTNQNVRVHFRDDYSQVTARSNTLYRDLVDGELFTEEGAYEITVTDGAGHTKTYNFTINRNLPSVEGVEDGKYYKENRTATFDDKNGTVTATLNGDDYISGTEISEEKTHKLVVTDDAGNSTEVTFTIDKTAPKFIGIDSNITTDREVTLDIEDDNLDTITVDGAEVQNGYVLESEGKYTVVATDKAGLSTTRIITIDTENPTVKLNGSTEYADGDKFENKVTIEVEDFTSTTMRLNGAEFTDTDISKSGKYKLEVEDAVGHVTTINFTIYKDAPEVTLISDTKGEIVADDETVKHYFNENVTIKIAENVLGLEATLNGETLTAEEIANGKTLNAVRNKHNEYELIVTDELGRSTTVNFAIDKKNPTSSVMSHTYNTDMLVHWDDESGVVKAILDGVEIENDTVTISEERGYRLQLIDAAGNSVMYYPTIDKSPATLVFTVDGKEVVVDDLTKKLYFNKGVNISYTDATFVSVVLGEEELVKISDRQRTGNVTLFDDGEYTLTITDSGNNAVAVKIKIDSKNPVAEIAAYENIDDETTDRTVDSVRMVLTVDEDVTWVDSNSFLWLKLDEKTEDGKFQYVYTVDSTTTGTITVTDLAGNSVDVPYTVTIDKENPNGNLVISTEETTKDDITMTLVVDELVDIEDVISLIDGVPFDGEDETEKHIWMKLDALSEDGRYQYVTTIKKNSKGILTFYDANRNNVSISYNITNIDKKVDMDELPSYSQNASLEATNQDVTITLTAREKLTFTDSKLNWTENKDANGIFTYTAVATENVSNELTITDAIGNTKTVNYAVSNIDKDAPIVGGLDAGIYLEANDTYLFNKNVVPTFSEGTAVLTRDFINEDGTPGQEITENFKSGAKITLDGVYTLVVTDKATNVTTVNIIVDKTKPTAIVTPSTTDFTNGSVILTVKTSEPVEMLTSNNALTQIDNQTWEFKKGINGTITFKFKDAAGNIGTAAYTVDNIDKTKPTIEGVENGGLYNANQTVTFEDENPGVSATLNGEVFAGGEVGHGSHVLIVTDAAGNKVTYRFTVDTVFPVITGVEDGGLYNKNVKPSFNEGTGVLTKKAVAEDGSIIDEVIEGYTKGVVLELDGIYTLTVTDDAGNATPVTFTIDKTAPTATVTPDVDPNSYTNGSVILTVKTSEPVEMLTSNAALTQIDNQTWEFKKGINGTITFKFKDAAGNIGTIAYTVDNINKTKPVITGIENKGVYNEPVQIYYTDDIGVKGLLNGEFMTSGEKVSEDGKYTLVVTDDANNTTTYTFTIDMTAPEITGVEDKGLYNKNVKPSFNEGTGVLTKKVIDENGVVSNVVVEGYKKGVAITEDGEYTLVVTDAANNSSTVEFTIDKTKPIATITPDTTEPTKGPVILTIKVDEPVEMLTKNNALTQIDNQTWTFRKGINGTITFKFKDAAGNIGTAAYTVDNIDKDAPVGTITPSISDATNGSVILTLEVNEPIKDMSESDWTLVKDATEDDKSVKYEKEFTGNTDGEITLTYTDLAGNAGNVKYSVTNIDKDAPTIVVSGTESSYTGLYTGMVTVTVSDANLASATYTKDNGEPVTIIDGSVELSESGTYIINATDSLGASSEPVTFVIDNSDPSISLSTEKSEDKVTDTLYKGAVTVTIDEANIYSLYVGGVLVSEPWTEKAFTEDGTYTIRVEDKVGRSKEVTFTIDTTKPVITIPGGNVIVTIKGNNITYPVVTANDANDGEVEVTQDKESVDINEAGEQIITYTATDEAGNVATETLTIRVLNVDKYAEVKSYMDMLEANSTGGFFGSLNENKYDYLMGAYRPGYYDYKKMLFDGLTMMIDGTIKLNPNITQEYMDQQIQAVKDAPLTPATKDMYDYNTALDRISKLVESDYSVDSWSKLQEKMAEAADNLNLQSDVNYYSRELNALVDSLVKNPVEDTTSEIFNKYLEEDYAGFTAYQTALTELSADVNEGIVQSEYDKRIKEIEDTMIATKYDVDDTTYRALLKDLEDNYKESDYTSESWAALQTKIAAVKEIVDANGLRSEYRKAMEKINLTTDLVLIPKVTAATISSNGNEGYAKPGDTITVEFETNVELDASSTVIINGKLTTFSKNETTGKYEASIVVGETDDEGGVVYTIHTVGPNQLEGEEYWGVTGLIVDVTKATGSVSYSTTDATNGSVTMKLTANEELSSVVDSNGNVWEKLSDDVVDEDGDVIEVHYEFTLSANASGTLTITDKAGNVTTDITYGVNNIDKTAATVESITYSNNGQDTKDDVTITMITSEKVDFTDSKLTWTEKSLEDGKYQYTATAEENVSNTLTLTDHVGNVTEGVTYTVTGIDKTAAKVEVSYTDADKELTNKDVTITLKSDKALSKITDTNGMNWMENAEVEVDPWGDEADVYFYRVTVSENISGTLTAYDHVGNETDVTYNVSNIDKVKPVGKVTYVTGALGSETSIEGNTATNKDVTIKLTSDKELVEIVDSNGKNWMQSVEKEYDLDDNFVSATYRLTVTENISGTLTIKDKAGNVVEGIEYKVSGIDKVAPEATLEPNTTDMTNQDVKLTLNVNGNEEVDIVDANVDYEIVDGKYVFTVTENTHVSVTIADKVGNPTTVTYNVENIDKVAPVITATIKETEEKASNGAYYKGTLVVTVNEGTLYDNGTEITNGAEITADGVHRLNAKDVAGNTTSTMFIGIDNTAPVVSGVEEDGIYDENGVTITATDLTAMTATIDGEAYTLGDGYTTSGHHTLVVTDRVGNSTTVEFDIVTEAPTIDIVGTKYEDIFTGDVTVQVTGSHIDTIKNGDEEIENGSSITGDGTYTITATDKAGHSASVTFIIDTLDPEIGGFEDGKTYSTSVTVTVSDANLVSATLKDGSVVENNTTYSEDGTYEITAVDAAGHSVTKSFTIDKLPPVVTGLEDGAVYTEDVTLDFNKGTATVNGVETDKGTVLSDGKYDVVVTSPAGLETKLSFTVDTQAPVINGFEDNAHYKTDVTVNVVDDNIIYIKKNGEEIENGSTFSADGVYEITTKDIAGREVTKTFTIDKTFPTITLSGTGKNGVYSTDVTIEVKDTNISTIKDSLGNTLEANATFNQNGNYTVIATDVAGNETKITFTIDKQAPVVTGVEDGQVYGEAKTVSFNKGTATLNGENFVSGTEVSDGKYELIVTGENDLSTTVNFIVDTVAPNITSIENGKVYGSDVKVEFNDATTRPTATVDGTSVSNGETYSTEGTHTLVVTDEAGNSTTVTFTIDKSAPVLEITDNKGEKHTESFEMTVEADKAASFADLAYTASDREGVTVNVGIDGAVELAELGNYTLTYTATDDVGNKKVITVTVRVKDTTAPVISMNGAEVIEVKYGSSYSDTLGATANDAFEGELEVKTTGKVDIYNVGDYEITYTAKDSSGNTATQKRIVKVVSTTASQLFRDANLCKDGTYCYGSLAKNNYVWYSGHLWRVVRVNADNTLRLVTEDAVSGFSFDDKSSVFVGSHAEKWLNNVFYPSLNNASSIVTTGEFCNEKLTSTTKVRYVCNANSVVNSKVGLLTIDEYNILGGQNGFLNNGDHFFTMTPTSEDTTWVVQYDGTKERGYYVNEPYAMRPVININPVNVVSGKGTATEPFRIAGDNSGSVGSALSTRSSGEYVNFGGKTWRVVSSSSEGTKLITDNYLTTNNGYVKTSFGTAGTFNTSTGIGQYLNTTVYDGFTTKEKSVIKLSRWYNNKYAIGQNPMDTTLVNGSSYTDAYVGLIRVGELMSGSTSTSRVDKFTYWTLNSANQNTWFISWGGTSEYSPATDVRGVRPVITLDNSVKIKSGNGTASSPYELEY